MSRTIRNLALATLLGTVACTAFGQSAAEQEIIDDAAAAKVEKMTVDAGYSITKTGFGSADRVIDPGTIYAFRIEGLLSRTVLDHVTPTNVIDLQGKLIPPAKGFVASFGASGDVQQIDPGDRYYLHAVREEDNALIFTFLSLNTTGVSDQNGSARSRLRLYLKFQLPKVKGPRQPLSAAELHALTDPILLPAGSSDAMPAIMTGQSAEDVRKVLGNPDKSVKFDNKVILLFKGIKVILTDGKVTNVE
jgi:hypothetical protein